MWRKQRSMGGSLLDQGTSSLAESTSWTPPCLQLYLLVERSRRGTSQGAAKQQLASGSIPHSLTVHKRSLVLLLDNPTVFVWTLHTMCSLYLDLHNVSLHNVSCFPFFKKFALKVSGLCFWSNFKFTEKGSREHRDPCTLLCFFVSSVTNNSHH